jgi:predicted ATP-grasp superfamily ATP-dependent carboligase
MIFPMDDCTMGIVMEHRDELKGLCGLPIAPYESYKIACDKGNAMAFVKEAGVDIPATYMPEDLSQLENILEKLEYPVIVKPRQSSGSRGIKKAYSKEELLTVYREALDTYDKPLVQEYIGSRDIYSVCLLYDMKGQLKASFVQKQVRHFPAEMGTSIVQESVYYPELIEKSTVIMDKLNWRGVVEIEYMVDKRNGRAMFMEMNPRFWGSVQAAIYAGVDFPWLLYNAVKGNNIEAVHDYTVGARCRWLLPGDILHFLTNKSRFKMDPPFFSRIKDDTAWLKDPMPVIGFMLACFRYLFDKRMWKMLLRK